MRLLKYPVDVAGGARLCSLVTSGDSLVCGTSDGEIIVWQAQDFAEVAFNRLAIDSLSPRSRWRANLPQDEHLIFLALSPNGSLILWTDHYVYKYPEWAIGTEDVGASTCIFQCEAPTTITDVKTDRNAIIVSTSNANRILFFRDSGSSLGEIQLKESEVPGTLITDPEGKILVALCADRSVFVFQYALNEKIWRYKLVTRLNQSVEIFPLNYNINMPPQGNMIPLINSIKNRVTPNDFSTILLDRNDNFKIAATLVTPSSQSSKVVSFSPVVYEKFNQKKNTKTRYNLLATSGSQEGTIVVWNTKRMKPLFSALRVSESPINDLIWSRDGQKLFGVSNDNVVYTFAFQTNDLGDILPEVELEKLRLENKQLPALQLLGVPLTKSIKEGEVKKDAMDKIKESFDTLIPTSENTNKRIKKTGVPASNIKGIKSKTMEFNLPSYNVPKDLKRKPKTENGEAKKLKKDLDYIDFLDTNLMLPNVAFSRVRLASPKIRLRFNHTPVDNSRMTVYVENGSGNEQKPTIITLKLKLSEGEKTQFEDFVPKFITMCAAGDNFWAFSSHDGIIYTYSDAGLRTVPPMILGAPISFLEANKKYLLCVTALGEVYTWNMDSKKLIFPKTNIYPLLSPTIRYSDDILTRAENITMCSITVTGIPLVTLSNGDGYLFDRDMASWLLVSDNWWAYGSQYWDMTNTSTNETNFNNTVREPNKWNDNEVGHIMAELQSQKTSIVNFLERKTNDELNRKGRMKNLQRFARTILMKEGYENLEEIVTLSHLENRILISMRIEETEEFCKLLSVYCFRLGELGYMERLSDVFEWLYNGGDIDSHIVPGKSRKDVLRNVIMICAENRQTQRLTNTYASMLGIV